MNDPRELLEKLFGEPEIAISYLASLMCPAESEKEYRIKMRQVSALRDFFESRRCPNGTYYLEKIGAIEAILQKDRSAIEQKGA